MKLPAGRFYGQHALSRFVASAGVKLIESHYAGDTRLPTHSHELAHFCIVIEGSYRERCGSREHHRAPSSVLFQPAGFTHAEEHHGSGRHLILEVEPRWTSADADHDLVLDQPATLGDDRVIDLTQRLCREAHRTDPESETMIEAAFLELLAETSRALRAGGDVPIPAWLDDARDFIHGHIGETLAIRRIARAVGIHPVHLARSFRARFHMTVGEYIRCLRVRRACHDLVHTNDSLAEIAARAGFSDPSHMTRTVKRHTGVVPSRYRIRFRG
jgi:AraC family transcriptional regulator